MMIKSHKDLNLRATSMSQATEQNRLLNEKSTYLQQHKNNPVHWWPYSPQALKRAKEENKPIFLSVGHSSCHWCHVMAYESFEDRDTANFLNENFICIKVDKEEFPDIDNYYQSACQLFTQTGGWPLNAFLLPDSRPFFVGTYFPKIAQRKEQTTFMGLLQELSNAYQNHFDKLKKNAEEVTKAISNGVGPVEKIDLKNNHFPPPAAILNAISQSQDKENGGYNKAPKFPHFSFYEFAVEQMLEGMIEKDQGEHIVHTLEKMLMGGLVDHARGGVHRYCVDEKWLIPHFEKMLYDQAGLIRLLAKFGKLYPSPLVYDTLFNTLNYLETEMLADDNIFFSAQDADSEGEEGIYFTFSNDEFEEVVKGAGLEDKMDKLKSWFNIKKKGTFERGLNIICLDPSYREEIFTPESWESIRQIRKALMEERKKRIPPATDNKGVASWNFMLLSSLVDVMQYCQIDAIRNLSNKLFNKALEGSYKHFLLKAENNKMRLRHTTSLESGLPYLEDFVNFAECQLRTYEVSGNPAYKDNFKDTMQFIQKEFIDNDKVLTRAKSSQHLSEIPNMELIPFCSSYKSSLSTLIALYRRGRVLFQEQNFLGGLEDILEKNKHIVLKNPLAAGEGLRAYIYPEVSYRVVKVPKDWLKREDFLKFTSHFMPRFVFDYSEEKSEQWQICNTTSCEVSGEGLNEFIDKLTPKSQNNE